MEAAEEKQQKHFVLVHGSCHGAWCWYKLKPLLESSGHRVTAVDLSACGINTKNIRDLHTLEDYSLPLMELIDKIPPHEKVVLVGHSYGGLSLGLAMEHYPDKISVAVFMAAFMPDSDHPPFYAVQKCLERYKMEFMLDTEFLSYGTPEDPGTSILFGPQFISFKMYQNCSAADLALAQMLIRPGSLFLQDSEKAKKFTAERFGSVKRAYLVCNEDKAIPLEFQEWLIQEIGVEKVAEIKDADHMAMLSMPEEVCRRLLDLAH